ncbi:MAG: CdaR family protein [Oscillospiraceae bacterium]
MEKKKVNKALYIALSVIIACGLWLYVVSVENNDMEKSLTGIPVNIVGEDVLATSNLMVTDGRNGTVSMKIQGKRSTLAKINRDNINIQVDVSKLAAPGEYSQAYSIGFPASVSPSEISVLDRTFYVNLKIGKRVSRQVEVRGEFQGTVAKGFQKGEFVFNPLKVDVSGEETLVSQVDYALVTLVREEPLSETFREDMAVTLISYTGEPLTGLKIQCNPATVDVTLPVVMVKEIPLEVDFVPGGGATEDDISYTITPKTVVVSGAESVLAAYDSINLGAVDLSKVLSSDTFTFPIPLGEELQNISGEVEATVTVQVNGLESKTLETDAIEVVNTPKGTRVKTITQSVQVQVRGTQKALDLVLSQYLRVVVDLKDTNLPKGQSMVPAKVYLDGGSGAGVVGEYKVAISVS